MEQDFLQILNDIGTAAVLLRGDKVEWLSQAAERMGLTPATSLHELLPDGMAATDFVQLQRFTLPAPWAGYYAQVCPLHDSWLLILNSNAPTLDYKALLQTSRLIRESMEDIVSTSQNLFAKLEEMESPAIQAQTARLNRGYYRLLRTSISLTELEQSISPKPFVPVRTELRKWLRDDMQPVVSAVAAAGKKLALELPPEPLYAGIHKTLLEQALLCLLSNAIRYSPDGAAIRLRLREFRRQCLFIMENPIADPVDLSALSGGFSRSPFPDENKGLGLGLLRVQNIAKQHGGVLLLECTPEGNFRATMRIPSSPEPSDFHVRMPEISEGGYNRMLVELSDVLPDSVFDSRNL